MRDLDATLGFSDECGVLLAPLIRSSLAHRGHTPILRQRFRHRDKVSVAGILTLSPVLGHISLYYQTYPDEYVDNELYAHLLRTLLGQVRGNLVLVHDGGTMHKGPPIRAVQADYPRLHLHPFPPYAPELNPVEYVWTDVKSHRLANFVPQNTAQIEEAVCIELEDIRDDQDRLRSYFSSSPLPWNNTTLLF